MSRSLMDGIFSTINCRGGFPAVTLAAKRRVVSAHLGVETHRNDSGRGVLLPAAQAPCASTHSRAAKGRRGGRERMGNACFLV